MSIPTSQSVSAFNPTGVHVRACVRACVLGVNLPRDSVTSAAWYMQLPERMPLLYCCMFCMSCMNTHTGCADVGTHKVQQVVIAVVAWMCVRVCKAGVEVCYRSRLVVRLPLKPLHARVRLRH